VIWFYGLSLLILAALGPILIRTRRHDFPEVRRRRRDAVGIAQARAADAQAGAAAAPAPSTSAGPAAPVRRRWNHHPATVPWWAHVIFAGLLWCWFLLFLGDEVGATIGAGVVLLVLMLWPTRRRRARPETFRPSRVRPMPEDVRKTIDETF